ncbi:MAG: TonB-dependent receptor [Acidobacteriota bacterium]
MRRLVVTLLLLSGVPALAQQGATIDMTGRVSAAGQPLAGVTVTLTSERLQGTRVAITGKNGGFLVPFLPPGNYELLFELEGFSSLRKRVRVALGATAHVEVRLEITALQETMIVDSPDPRIPAGTSIGTTFRAAEIDLLPVGRDVRSIVLLSPSASGEESLMIAGAPSWDSLFLVDGVVANEYQTGQPHPIVFEDAIQEVVVLSGGISAEYGRFTGGVVSTITKSGGNEFHGSLRDRVTNGAWQARTPWSGEPSALNATNHAVEGTLGGFFLRDRLWFFLAARDAQSSARRFTNFTNVRYQSDTNDQRGEAKLTARLSPRHSLIGSFVTSSIAETNVTARSPTGVLDRETLIPERRQPLRFLALTSTSVLPAQWFTEVQYSTRSAALRGNGGRSTDRILGTLLMVRGLNATANAPMGCGICGDDRRDSTAWSAKASHYRNTGLGNHTLVLGADGFRENRQNRGTRSSSEFSIQTGAARVIGSEAYPLFGAGTLIFWTPYYVGERGSDLGSTSAFLSDRWELNPRFTLNIGLRYDRNRARDALGRAISDDYGISPRLSAAWDLRADGRQRLLAGYGRYAAKILEGGGSPQQAGVFNQFVWRYAGPEINSLSTAADRLLSTREAMERLFAWFDSVGGVEGRDFLTGITNPDSSGDFNGSLRSPAVDEWSVGYLVQGTSGTVRLDYVARDWKHFYAARVDTTTGQRQDSLGNTLDVAQFVNDDDGTVRTYHALQLQGSWQRGSLSAGGGYSLSSLRGNDEGEDGVDSAAPRNKPLALWYPELLGYAQRRPIGYLRQDQRHRARVWLTWGGTVGRGSLHIALLQRFDSGTPYSAVADIDPTGRSGPFDGVPQNPGYALNLPTVAPYFFSKRGAFRTDDVWSTDLGIGCELAGRLRPLLRIEVFNLLNRAAVVSPGTEVLTRRSAGASSGLRTFNPLTEKPIEGVHYVRSASFGLPTGPESYQAPRRFQISVGVRF